MPPRTTARTQLKPAQQRVLAVLEQTGAKHLTRGRYEEIARVSRSQAAYDIAELVAAGILERIGGGRSTSYRLARRQSGKRRWTPERIRSSLEAFCAGRTSWPSAGEFRAAGRGDLYIAASRYGGVAYWTAELGFGQEPSPRRRWRLPRPPLRVLAPAAALVALLLALGGGRVFTHPQRIVAGPLVAPATAEPARPRAETAVKPTRARAARTAGARAARPLHRAVATPVMAAPRPRTLVAHVGTARAAPQSAAVAPGPTPLAAPSTSGGAMPAPLPAPG